MTIAILDFGSQTAQLIARRVREENVYCELFPWDTPAEMVFALKPKGFILSGGPASVFTSGAPQLPGYILDSGKPTLGICYGMQALTHALGGKVAPSKKREFGHAKVETLLHNPLLSERQLKVWMSHGDHIETPPSGFVALARSENGPVAAMGDLETGRFGVQFHPEVHHTPKGVEILRRFVIDVCGAEPDWTPESIISQSVRRIREQVCEARVLSAVSGGVDSSVATALVHQAIGDQLVAVFVDTGLLREDEPLQVVETFQQNPSTGSGQAPLTNESKSRRSGNNLGVQLIAINAVEEFMETLHGVTDPEEKRRVIGERFIRIFEAQARKVGLPPFLVQGTIYPDVVESSAPDRSQAARIKTHHNVGGLPEDIQFELVEPLRYLFKDEVRAVGERLGLSPEIIWRQPFPGPGLAVRCLGEVTSERLARLRAADKILIDELTVAGLLRMRQQNGENTGSAQAFSVLLPVQSVGVMGDKRTYQETVALRVVTTEDFMTADWARLPYDLLARISTRIVNEVEGVNRVVYDITSKPPATIEWE